TKPVPRRLRNWLRRLRSGCDSFSRTPSAGRPTRPQRHTKGRAMQPWADRLSLANFRRRFDQGQKSRLEGVFCVLLKRQQSAANSPDERTMSSHDRCESSVVAFFNESANKLRIGSVVLRRFGNPANDRSQQRAIQPTALVDELSV